MEKIYQDNKGQLVFDIILLIIGCTLAYFSIVRPLSTKSKQKEETSLIDCRLKICNNDLLLDDSILLCRFIPVVGGEIIMGSSAIINMNYRQDTTYNNICYDYQKKYIHSFLIAEIPVTKKLYEYIINNNPPDSLSANNYREVYQLSTPRLWDNFILGLCAKTGRDFRLPTKDEWEYAAYGGNKGHGYKYAGSNDIEEVAFYKGNCDSADFPHIGKLKKPNELGLYDMSGNIYELVSTTAHQIDPVLKEMNRKHNNSEFKDVRILKGGCWKSPENECEVFYKGNLGPDDSTLTGIRLVLIR